MTKAAVRVLSGVTLAFALSGCDVSKLCNDKGCLFPKDETVTQGGEQEAVPQNAPQSLAELEPDFLSAKTWSQDPCYQDELDIIRTEYGLKRATVANTIDGQRAQCETQFGSVAASALDSCLFGANAQEITQMTPQIIATKEKLRDLKGKYAKPVAGE
ncbi:MAG: hypothetical protein OXT65_01005 [Alphaproteobacteria bacterium]|nr:hypothetical protein [Alphaproteobacteria bacterium]